jgi:hypothetical protein
MRRERILKCVVVVVVACSYRFERRIVTRPKWWPICAEGLMAVGGNRYLAQRVAPHPAFGTLPPCRRGEGLGLRGVGLTRASRHDNAKRQWDAR